MNINMLQTLDNIPFPIVVTKRDYSIKYYNSLFHEQISDVETGVDVRQLFDEWEDKEKNLVSVTFHEAQYLLIYNYRAYESQELIFFILADGLYIKLLQEKINELDKLNEELDAIIDNSYDAIYITDREGTTLRTNSAIERITGIPKHYYIGKKVDSLIKRGILGESVTFKVLKQGKTVSQIQNKLAGKEILMTGTPIFNKEGEIEKVITNIRDLSELNALHHELKKTLELNNQYRKELERLKSKTRQDPDVIVESKRMLDIYDMADRIADFDATVLILGETGVGKDILARHIYRSSQRHGKGKFVKINCGAIPYDLLESELFGYEAGAFTGANQAGKQGLFELADKGVLFLDEIGELPLALQVKLLRVLQEKQIQRIGGIKPKKIDVRLVAATNRDLKEMVKKGEFREDLFYRLNVIPIFVPPLRERKEDILPLVQYFLKTFNEKYRISKEFDRNLKEFFYHYDWPGNVRELSNLIERLVLTVPSKVVTVHDLPTEYHPYNEAKSSEHDRDNNDQAMGNDQGQTSLSTLTLKEAIENAERRLLTFAVQQYNSTYKIAEKLGTSQATIVRKLKKYNLTTLN
ncbi:sigma-54 interaction domain-containing protein [Laceyella putida]|uniref:HTH-type transcriptional regulatory protein TyrR n=1 Tax=Laceyella putida TaxID=110101 RepID=A0ABW2RJL3_9BACL